LSRSTINIIPTINKTIIISRITSVFEKLIPSVWFLFDVNRACRKMLSASGLYWWLYSDC